MHAPAEHENNLDWEKLDFMTLERGAFHSSLYGARVGSCLPLPIWMMKRSAIHFCGYGLV
jgi:hypothetical protein